MGLDPFLYDFSTWSFLQGIDPLSLGEGSRTLTAAIQYNGGYSWFPILMKLQMHTENGATFTVSDLLFSLYNSPLLKGGILTFVVLIFYEII